MTLIKSMTGYGRAVETVNGREFTVELRSVNNRYLDCSVRLPRILSFAEDTVKQAVKASVSRGKVDVYISMRSEGGEEVSIQLNKNVLEGYLQRYGLGDWAQQRYAGMAKKAGDCIGCGVCETRCPYNLPIREMLARCKEEFGA